MARNKNHGKRAETRRLLFNGCEDEHEQNQGTRQIYDPNFHPADVLAYFKDAYDAITDPTRYRTDKGQVGYVTKPVRPPTQTRYATKVGVTPATLWVWAKQYQEFGDAMEIAKAYQASLLVELGSVGALTPTVVNFTLKNLHGWTEKVEETHKGSVAFQFDADDEDV